MACSMKLGSNPARCCIRQQAAARVLVPRASRKSLVVRAGVVEPGSTVLVAGATGGVGQLVTAKLLEAGYKVRAVARSDKSRAVQGAGANMEVVVADLREASQVAPLMEGVSAVVCVTGTTAFPSSRWEGNNGPRMTDWVASSNLINAAAAKSKQIQRYVLVTSAGVERQKELPWLILNTFGVLRYKRDSEVLLESSGLPWTVLRPGRLTDGPYTSFDLNTLLQATSGSRRAVQLSLTDSLKLETSRIAVADAAVAALGSKEAENKAFALASLEGQGPGNDRAKWGQLFATAQP